ncbi:AraC-type DNA-binding protein [Actinacidiphila alni]|uniref:AraC-type DNA-binding protein n=1 Tax=Actinacidiphila alni TaxID=380248 RepID=A0A1I1XAT8_9ACTN|nr:AraC family transcriptional regulator [Actinacidiphila alni]SFE02480.1 AraC-type DNA-binding protein [Actinacidiphila alni]
MDALANLLDGPRARGAFLLRSILTPPWSLRIEDRAPLCLALMVSGEGWVVPDSGEPVRLRPGDIAVIRGPEPYTVADAPTTAPRIVIHPGQISATPEGVELCEEMDLGVRTWGDVAPEAVNAAVTLEGGARDGAGDTGSESGSGSGSGSGDADGSAVMITGTYQMRGEISQRLLSALPHVLLMPGDAWTSPLPALLREEIVRDEPGQEVVLDRLLDLLLIAVLRAWFSRPEAGAPAWYVAQSDPVVGPALRLLHDEPAHPWTVAALATRTGVSRAALGRRFTELVGEPPMSYLTNWRLALAADLLREPDATIGAVARKVGYGSPFALSAAFKRVRGVSPQQHREGAVADAEGVAAS